MIGRTLGSYRILEQIGQGGMATVYKAYDPATDRYVALKLLPEYFSKDDTFRQRFEREAKAVAKLEHIHILPIFAYGEGDGIAYLVMRYMQAGTLAERIEKGMLPLEEASQLLSQIASALDHAHKHGILHRDVKPSNVLIDADGNAFLTDFGIARMVEGSSELTGSGLIGTPHYMSPEQCQGNKNLTPASDQYSLGIVLYEMLTGTKPYQAETPVAVILMHLNDPLLSPRSLRPEITEEMEGVVFKALAKQPDLRYPNCGAMAAAFAQAVASQQTQVASASPAEPAPSLAPLTQRVLSDEVDRGTIRVAPPQPKQAKIPSWALIALAVIVVGGGITALLLLGLISPKGGANVTGPSTQEATSAPVTATHRFATIGGITIPGTSDWVDSRITVSAGKIYHVVATGTVKPCTKQNPFCVDTGPAGIIDKTPRQTDAQNIDRYPLPDAPVVALVAQVGQGQPFLVGESVIFTASADGTLHFRVNDFPLDNNSGEFLVTVEEQQ